VNWWLRLRRRRALEEDLADEIAFHRHMRLRDEAPPPFGNETLIRERMRDLWSFSSVETTLRDIVVAIRGWRKNPVFAITIVASLALGIGAVIAIFTAADDLLFRPLPYRDPGRLVMVLETTLASSETGLNTVSPDNFLDWKSRNSVFEDMAYIDEGRSVFGDGGQSEELHAQRVPPDFFGVLGVQPLRGHLASSQDSLAPSGDWESQVVISYRLWQSWFGRAPDIIGRRVRLDSFPRTVSAVMPPGFSFGDREVDLWPYMKIYPSPAHHRGARNLQAVARLKRGISLGQAQAQMTAIARQLEQADPQFNSKWAVALVSLRHAFSRNVRTSLVLLLGAVALLLAVACTNAANLLLGRYSARRAEIAMRVALGAGRWRLIRQLLTESLLIAVCSGMVGLAVGRSALAGLVAIAPRTLTQTADVTIDWRIVLAAVGFSLGTGVLFGLAPSIIGARTNVACRAESMTGWRMTSRHSARAWLIAGEIAVSVVLLAGGSLLFRSLARLQHTDSGLDPRNVLTFHFRVMSPHDVIRFSQAIQEIERLPGVRSASATSFLPFDGRPTVTPITITGGGASRSAEESTATVRTVMPRYFETLGIPIRRGRDFTEADNTAHAPVRFIVNEAFARSYLGSQDPLTKTIMVSMARSNPPGQIVGVVGDVKEGSLRKAPVPTVYYVYSRMPYGQMTLVVRTERDPLAVAPSVRRVVRHLDPQLAVADMRPMEAILRETYARERFLAVLMGSFSACALLLAAIGIYGILAYSVSLRAHEIGIRQAVGAEPSQITRMVLVNGSWFVIVGLVAGIGAALALTRLLSSLLFNTSTNDPGAFVLAIAVLLSVALASAYIPARRASRLDPMRALRSE